MQGNLDQNLQADIEKVSRVPSIPTVLEVVCRTTGMGFAAIARVTESRWVACSVLDEIDFGLKTGGELRVETTICNEIQQSREVVAIDHVASDIVWRSHATPALYGFESYVSVPIILADGSFFGTLCAIDPRPTRVNTPQVLGMFRLFAELIAKHLDAQNNLAAMEAALELIHNVMESNPDGVAVLDFAGNVLSMNQNGFLLFETEPRSTVNESWLKFWPIPEDEKASSALRSAIEGNRARFSGYCTTGTGVQKFLEVVITPVKNSSGVQGRVLAIARDMTVRRAEEAQLRETAKLESLGVLAGGIAHDFNNLLTGVLGNASLLEMSANAENAALAGEIVHAAQRAADLTQQMLAYSGRGRFLVRRINLSSAIEEILQLIKASIDKKVEIKLDLDSNLPAVEADPVQMQQLIMNVIINGSEAIQGKEGKLSISTTAIDVDADFIAQTFRSEEFSLTVGRYVRLEVHDTGCGMTEETITKIFDPFFTTKFTGRGLGLAAVSGILRGHNGTVRVDSQLGQGTTFKIFLPVADELSKSAASEPEKASLHAQHGLGTILLVDDEAMVRRVGKVSLEHAGYDILLAENGIEAVELFQEQHGNIRLVILDLTMPVMSGEEALSLLHAINPDIPILLSSGYNQEEFVQRFTKQNVKGFIQKPYTITQLQGAVASALVEPF